MLDIMPISGPVREELVAYTEKYEHDAPNLLRPVDYRRWTHVFRILPENSTVLDIGVGAGQFVNALARSNRFTQVIGLDVRPHSKFWQRSSDYEVIYADASNIPLEDHSIDYVSCQEVLEHLDDKSLKRVISEITRVSKKGFYLTVPFNENPLPKYHLQRFNLSRLFKLFPDAKFEFFSHKNALKWVSIYQGFTSY